MNHTKNNFLSKSKYGLILCAIALAIDSIIVPITVRQKVKTEIIIGITISILIAFSCIGIIIGNKTKDTKHKIKDTKPEPDRALALNEQTITKSIDYQFKKYNILLQKYNTYIAQLNNNNHVTSNQKTYYNLLKQKFESSYHIYNKVLHGEKLNEYIKIPEMELYIRLLNKELQNLSNITDELIQILNQNHQKSDTINNAIDETQHKKIQGYKSKSQEYNKILEEFEFAIQNYKGTNITKKDQQLYKDELYQFNLNSINYNNIAQNIEKKPMLEDIDILYNVLASDYNLIDTRFADLQNKIKDGQVRTLTSEVQISEKTSQKKLL